MDFTDNNSPHCWTVRFQQTTVTL